LTEGKVVSNKFLLIKEKDSLKIVSQLSHDDINSSLTKQIEQICNIYRCDKNIDFENDTKDDSFDNLIEKLLFFIKDNNISKASIIANAKDIDLDFLLNSEEELNSLSSLYKDDIKNFNINDKSSVVQILSITDIESSINDILNKQRINIDSKIINFKTRKVLNQIFRRLKALGNIKVELYISIDETKIDILKSFINENYPWVKSIDIIKSDKNSIKIKEVMT
jgi:hypothetical protein